VNLKPLQVIQSIKRLGFNLVSKKTCGLDLEPDDVGQKGQNYSTYDNTHENSKTQNQKMFFSLRIQKLAKSFEDLNSSLAQSAEKPSCKVTWKLLCQAENTGS